MAAVTGYSAPLTISDDDSNDSTYMHYRRLPLLSPQPSPSRDDNDDTPTPRRDRSRSPLPRRIFAAFRPRYTPPSRPVRRLSNSSLDYLLSSNPSSPLPISPAISRSPSPYTHEAAEVARESAHQEDEDDAAGADRRESIPPKPYPHYVSTLLRRYMENTGAERELLMDSRDLYTSRDVDCYDPFGGDDASSKKLAKTIRGAFVAPVQQRSSPLDPQYDVLH